MALFCSQGVTVGATASKPTIYAATLDAASDWKDPHPHATQRGAWQCGRQELDRREAAGAVPVPPRRAWTDYPMPGLK